jgi:nicotinate phosphoribosyltransferase
MNAVQKLYPTLLQNEFINREGQDFQFARALRKEVDAMAFLALTKDEEAFIKRKCYYFDAVFTDLFKGYRYDPSEVRIEQQKDNLKVEVKGFWYRTVLWEVPLLALISELYFRLSGLQPLMVEENASAKASGFASINADYSDFGTRRRFSAEVQERVIRVLSEKSEGHRLNQQCAFHL